MDHAVPLLPENTNAPTSSVAKKIGIGEASKFYDETMIVTGKVVQVTVRPTITFINLDQAGPTAPFSVVIFPENMGKFEDLQKLQGQDVEITGTIQEYRNKPEIILELADQVKVMDGK